MPLVDSPRLTPADRAEWVRLATLDNRLAAANRGRLDRLADTARTLIGDYADRGACWAGVSWGRDSTVLAHLVAADEVLAGRVPLVYATSAAVPGRVANPDSPAVRDAFLTRHPHVTYRELDGGLLAIERVTGVGRRVTGIRADESSARRWSARRHGAATDRSCRPLLGWSTMDVWTYLALHDLPVHPAYAMSQGGVWERDRLRVHSIGGVDGSAWGRLEWEDTYYGDLTEALRGWTVARP